MNHKILQTLIVAMANPLLLFSSELDLAVLLEAESHASAPETAVHGRADPLPRAHTATAPTAAGASGTLMRPALAPVRPFTRLRMLEEVDSAWVRPLVANRGAARDTREEDLHARSRLETIAIPKLELREMPLSRVVEVLAEVALQSREAGDGLNIVLIDPEGRDPLVSIMLRHVSLRRALDFITESVGYEFELQRDAVVIRRSHGLGHGLETAYYPIGRSTLIRLTGIHEGDDSGPPAVGDDPFAPPQTGPPRSHPRKDTEQQLKAFLQRAGIAFDGIPGADLALADGQLIVTQTPRNHEKTRRLLQRYREVKQVEIEARFLEVQERNLEELGIEWTLIGRSGRVSNSPVRNLANAFTVGQDESRILIDRPEVELMRIGHGAPVLPMTVDLAETAASLVSLSGVVKGLDVTAMIRALERQSGNDLLSAPKLTVLSGKTAEIVVAEEFRYPEVYGDMNAEVGRGDSSSGSAGVAITAGTPRQFATRNVGVEMEVTATVEDDNAISLRLRPKVTEFEGFVQYGGTSVAIASGTTVTVPSGFYQPVFSVRRIDTEVTVWDGATVVMGGLTREHSVRIHDKIPLLGSLPLLGRFFRSDGESTQKRNLLIFVTANLISPGGSPAFQYLPGLDPNTLYQQPGLLLPDGLRPRGGDPAR